MRKVFRWLAAAVVAASFSPLLHATVITFEGDDLTGAYFPGDTFTQNGFLMTQEFDPGTVDFAAALGAVAPTGNATQFYFNSNAGDLLIESLSGAAFSLDGFSAAFVPGALPPANPIGIVAFGTTKTGTQLATLSRKTIATVSPSTWRRRRMCLSSQPILLGPRSKPRRSPCTRSRPRLWSPGGHRSTSRIGLPIRRSC